MGTARNLLSAFRTGHQSLKLSKAIKKAHAEGNEAVLAAIAPWLDELENNIETAGALIWAMDSGPLPPDSVAEIFSRILDAHGADLAILIALGGAIESARDIDDLNAPPSECPLFRDLVRKLSERQLKASDPKMERDIADAIAATSRLMGRQKDSIAERAYKRMIELAPDDPYCHYGIGLFYKTRGRFAEGMAANQRAIELAGDKATEAMKWNLGICATGAGEGQVALEVWRAMGNKLEIGRLGLPLGGYPSSKVRLAERPLAERGADNDNPGLEETIWIQPSSPCHGIVMSVLYQEDLGVDFGDTVLFDGAPITYHRYGDNSVPVFPHLVTLDHGNFHFYPFAATRLEGGVVETINDQLENAIHIYSHTENCYTLCAACMANEDVNHAHEKEKHAVIQGRIAISPDVTAAKALALIDAAYSRIEGARLFAPDLAQAAGDEDRARLEMSRFLELSKDA